MKFVTISSFTLSTSLWMRNVEHFHEIFEIQIVLVLQNFHKNIESLYFSLKTNLQQNSDFVLKTKINFRSISNWYQNFRLLIIMILKLCFVVVYILKNQQTWKFSLLTCNFYIISRFFCKFTFEYKTGNHSMKKFKYYADVKYWTPNVTFIFNRFTIKNYNK